MTNAWSSPSAKVVANSPMKRRCMNSRAERASRHGDEVGQGSLAGLIGDGARETFFRGARSIERR
jgi:hypothetical protein